MNTRGVKLKPFPIRFHFLLFIPLVDGLQGELSVVGGHRIKDPDVHEGFLSSGLESTSIYVHPGLVGGVGRFIPHVFTVQGEKSWFSGDVTAHLPEITGRHIPHLVVHTNFLFLHVMVWLTSFRDPHAQVLGISFTDQPYLRATVSTNSCLLRLKSFALIGKHVNQLDAPISCAV